MHSLDLLASRIFDDPDRNRCRRCGGHSMGAAYCHECRDWGVARDELVRLFEGAADRLRNAHDRETLRRTLDELQAYNAAVAGCVRQLMGA